MVVASGAAVTCACACVCTYVYVSVHPNTDSRTPSQRVESFLHHVERMYTGHHCMHLGISQLHAAPLFGPSHAQRQLAPCFF